MHISDLFMKGVSVANPAAWKKGQITSTVLGGLILAAVNVARAFGVEVPIDVNGANAIGTAILVVVNCVLTVTTSTKMGFGEEK